MRRPRRCPPMDADTALAYARSLPAGERRLLREQYDSLQTEFYAEHPDAFPDAAERECEAYIWKHIDDIVLDYSLYARENYPSVLTLWGSLPEGMPGRKCARDTRADILLILSLVVAEA